MAEVQRREAIALEANWSLVSVTMSGKTVEAPGGSITFAGGKMIMKDPAGATTTYVYRIDPLAQPKSIEMTDAQDTNAPPRYAIYELKGEGLRLCLGGEGKPPTAFDADGGRVLLLHRK
ncbi:MAG: TIGR03067 domain-containing protein [Verrucomicrobia bacterium]|nr:TIGR03067 domain-containing protein [Verrucomicrobiota bacterium]